MAAKISKSTWGSTYRVEERVGNTLYYTNHDSLDEAVDYCENNRLEYVIEEE